MERSPFGRPHHSHKLCDFFALVGLVAAGDRMFDTMRQVILQHLVLDTAQRGTY